MKERGYWINDHSSGGEYYLVKNKARGSVLSLITQGKLMIATVGHIRLRKSLQTKFSFLYK